MKVFIENPAGSKTKNVYNEQTLEFQAAYSYARATPYHYGFIMNTASGDGDCLDCFVLSDKPMSSGTIVEVDPIGMVEYIDSGETDNKILGALKSEKVQVNETAQDKITNFLLHVFDNRPERKVKVGRFYGFKEANELVERSEKEFVAMVRRGSPQEGKVE